MARKYLKYIQIQSFMSGSHVLHEKSDGIRNFDRLDLPIGWIFELPSAEKSESYQRVAQSAKDANGQE